MAKAASKTKSGGYEALRTKIKKGELKNLYLFFGEEEYIKNEYASKVINMIPEDPFGGFNTIKHEGAVTDLSEINDALENFPMMAEKKTIIIKDSGIFSPKKGKKKDSGTDGETEADASSGSDKDFWLKWFENMPDYAVLIFIEKSADKRSSLYKAAAKYGMAAEFEHLTPDNMTNWALSEFMRQGKKISKENVSYFVGICETDVSSVKNEIDKLSAYCGDEVLKSDIDRLVSRSLNVRIFEMTDGIMEKKAEKVMTALAEMKSLKEPPFKILYTLMTTFVNMLRASLLDKAGMSYDEVVRELGVHPFAAKKYIQGAKGLGEDFLAERVRAVAETDLAIKRGELSDWDALEKYAAECIYRR